jgi:predicted N-acetyltransferase YhbS
MEKISCAKPEDFTRILRFLEEVYNHTTEYYSRHFSAFWQEETFDPARTYVICDEGRISSLVRVFPLRMVLGGAEAYVGGIGAVSTAVSKRGRGYMSRLLNDAIREMEREGFALSVLGGDRHRYHSFGYEHGGRRVSMWFTPRSLAKCKVTGLAPRRYFGDEAVLPAIIAAYQAHPYYRIRSLAEHRLTYGRHDILVFYQGQGEEFGYLVMGGEQGRGGVLEFGGCPQTVLAIAADRIKNLGLDGIQLFFPVADLVPEPFREAASNWQVNPAYMVKIIDLDRTLTAFASQANQGAAVPTADELRGMPEPRRVDTLFGTLGPRPFNFFIWPLDKI